MTDKYGRVVKGEHLSLEAEFKKRTKSYKPTRNAGTELIMGGNVRVKLTNGKWGYKKRLVYERLNGKIMNNDIIVFLDNDKLNCAINNLYRVSRKEIAVMNRKKLFTTDSELTLCGILYVKILLRCKELEKE